MKILTMCKILCLSLIICLTTNAYAQTKGSTISVKGEVLSDAEGVTTPLPYAIVALPTIGVATTTNDNGVFVFPKLIPDIYEVEISSLGYETLKLRLDLKQTQNNLKFKLLPSNFNIENVIITAKSNKTGASTASTISRTAMDHMQTNSLADIMSLLPGALVSKQLNLQGVSGASIRGGGSFGTAVIMDGSQISNNANMQIMNSSTGAANPASGGVGPTTGIDLRTITTDNIESIEIMRGVASVEYGDISSGAIIVNTKAGKQPLNITFRTNPNIYSFSATKGIALGEKGKYGNVNFGADYAYSVANPTEGYDYYQRTTARLGYSHNIGKLYTNSSLNFLYNTTKGEPNPDDEYDLNTYNQNDWGIRFATNGIISVSSGWFKNIKYDASFNYTNRHSYVKDEASNADWAYSNSREDGSILSSTPGQDIFNTNGDKITNIPRGGESYLKGWMLPGTYIYEYDVFGKEINTSAKVLANFSGKIGATNHRIIVGADYRNEGNLGKGKIFDENLPPYRNLSYQFAAQRNRAFNDIPFINQFGVFAEENFRYTLLKREINITAGVRLDKVINFKHAFSPRINASIDIIPRTLSISGAYGITHKTPNLAYLYPDNAYFDILNFNNGSTSKPDAQKFQMITTRIFDTQNPDLEMAKTTKYEVGLTARVNKMTFSVVAFKDKSNNQYTFRKTPQTIHSVPFATYKAPSYPADGVTLPALTLDYETPFLLEYTMPTNNSAYETKGIEFDFDFGRIKEIRTSFILNGSFSQHISHYNGYVFWQKIPGTDYRKYPHMGVYNAEEYSKQHDDIFATNLLITHNIPKIGFVITLTTGVVWKEQSWQTYENNIFPNKYISRIDGTMHDITRDQLDLPEFAGIDRRKEVTDLQYQIEPAYPPLLCMNINITKEFKNHLKVSFFANNMFKSNPLYRRQVINPGKNVRRNEEIFFFGLQLSAIIK